MDEFLIPGAPEHLWDEAHDLPLKVVDLQDLAESSPEEVEELAEGLAFALCDRDPLCVVEQANFDQLASLLRCFHLVDGPKRRQLVDALCSSLTCLVAWIDRLLADEGVQREEVITYRSAFKAYVFFLQWLAELAGRESREAEAAQPAASAASTAGGGGRGRKKKAAGGGPGKVAGWQWGTQFPKVIKSVSLALNTDLRKLFRPNRPEEGLMMRAIQLATAALESPAAAKDEHLAGHAAHILGVCALKYDQLEVVSSALVELLNKYEHTPEMVAELLRYSVANWDDTRLAAAVIGEVAAVDPAEYERQQKAAGEKAGARSVAAFIEHLAQKLPKVMAQQISLLLPHLGGEAHVLRCAIVTAIGHLLQKGIEAQPGETADAQGAEARLRTKQHLLDVLVERIRDHTSYVRKDVLQTWQTLASANAIPLGHWQCVTDIAVGRLEDKSSLARKEALRLLQALMVNNPFGPRLDVDRYATSLREHRSMLEQCLPPAAAGPEEAWSEMQIQREGEGGEEASAGADPEAPVAVKPEPGTEEAAAVDEENESPEEEMVDAEGEVAAEEEAPVQQEAAAAAAAAQPEPQQPLRTPAEVGWDGTLEELKALVASLELAVAFTQALSSTMPVLSQLLASSTASDVQEAIAMLLTCKQFAVDGAPDTIRKMLPLIFSREQAVKTHIVEALDQLYITGWAGNMFSSEQAARNLIELASGATLGELGALEEVVKEFMGKGFLTPIMLHELWGIADKAYEAVARGATQADRAHKDLRAALVVLGMAAACQPQAFNKRHLLDLLRYGFSTHCPDALITRHACTALTRLAENFQTGAYDDVLQQVYSALTCTIIASPLPEASWFSAAESAVTAIYALHPTPEQLSVALLKHMAGRAFEGRAVAAAVAAGGSEGEQESEEEAVTEEPSLSGAGQQAAGAAVYSASALSRFFFLLGHVALQHLVYVERMAKIVRRSRHEAEKKAAEERSEALASGNSQPDGQEDINAQLGVGSVAADAELDAMKEASESQILAMRNLLGPYARVVSAVCHNRVLLACDAQLRSSALLALTKLMVVDAHFCEQNLQLLFTLLANRSVEAGLRSNLIIALGDLALRFPNLLEPWTEHIYKPLGDPDIAVRKNTLMVLTHLILNDMMKVKGHIAKMAVCLEDGEERIAALAQLFFHELAKKEYKGTSPIYNLLPDILSNLSKETSLSKPQFQSIMQQLLAHIKKDKQGDALIEKLCQRFAATEDVQQWHCIAFCMTQLQMSEKGLKKLCDSFKLYKHALGDEEVAAAFTGIFGKAKKGSAKAETKALIEEFEAKLTEYAAERAEEERTAEAARAHADRRRGGAAQTEASMDDASESLGGAPADSALVSDMRGQLAGLDISGAAPEVKPDPDAPAGGALAPASSAIEEDAISTDGEEEEGEERPAGGAAEQQEQEEDEEEEEEEEEEEAASPPRHGARRSSRSAGAAAAEAAPARKAPSRRSSAAAAQQPTPGKGRTSARRSTRGGAGEEEEENTSLAANAPAGRGRVAALAAKFGGATQAAGGSKKGATTRRSGTEALEAGMAKVKIEPQD